MSSCPYKAATILSAVLTQQLCPSCQMAQKQQACTPTVFNAGMSVLNNVKRSLNTTIVPTDSIFANYRQWPQLEPINTMAVTTG